MRKILLKDRTKRTRTKFLFAPKTIKGEKRWLEKATWEEYCLSSDTSGQTYWYGIRWINKMAEWIKVEDGLPEKSGIYRGRCEELEYKGDVYFNKLMGEWFGTTAGGESRPIFNLTSWQPITPPEDPKDAN